MNDLYDYLIAGSLLGFTAGISPGPMLTLVITQTIKHNRNEGVKVALSPLISDLPIVVLSIFLVNEIAKLDVAFAIISMIGGIYLFYLGIESYNTKTLNIHNPTLKTKSIQKGILANITNPSPYLFWITVGTPIILKAYNIDLSISILFLISFYLFLIGSKITIAILVSKTKKFINDKYYRIIMKVLGIALIIFAMIFFKEALTYVGVLR